MKAARFIASHLLAYPALLFLSLVGSPATAHAQAATATVLQQTSACQTTGCVTTLTATVTSSQKPVSLGLVYLCDGTGVSCENQVPLGVFQLPSTGTVTLKIELATGTHTLYAIFHGTKACARSKSAPLVLTIAPIASGSGDATVTSISASGSSEGYTLSSTVSALKTPATGTVSFLDTSNHNALVATGPLIAGRSSPIYAPGGLDFSKVQQNSLAGATSAISGDFNNDGYQDIVVGGMLLLGNGKGGFTPTPLPVGVPAPPVSTIDFNRDGLTDQAYIAFLTPTGDAVYVNLGNGDGTFTPAPQSPLYPLEDNLGSLIIADFRSNGYQDIAFLDEYSYNFMLLPGNGDGTFGYPVLVGGGGSAYFASDFDGDGLPDILMVGGGFPSGGSGSGNPLTYGSTITLYHGNGDLTFTARPTQTIVPSGDGLVGFTTGDLNGDGILDLLATFSTPTAAQVLQPLFYNAKKTAFDPGPTIPLSSGNLLTFADFNGDGPANFATFGPYPITGYTYEEIAPASATTGPGVTLPGATTHNVIASYPGDSLHTASSSTAIPLLGSATGFPSGIGGEAGIAVNGAATIQGSSIQLTDGKQFEAGSFFSANRFFVADGFSTDFDFQLTNAAADGFAFVLQNTGPDAIGVNGGGLGYGSAPGTTTGGIPYSVAVAFDLHNNRGEGNNSVRLEYGGITGNEIAGNLSADLTPSGINLHSGHPFHANITSSNSFFTITITDLDTKAVFTKTLPTGVQTRISGYLNGSVAYVGFTGGTGNTTAIQTISNWVFTPSAEATQLYISPTYPTGFTDSSSLHFNGGAAVSGSAIDLTYGTNFEASSVYFTSPAAPTGYPYGNSGDPAPIFTDFDFQVVNGIGDGFTFVMQDQGLNAVGSTGGGLGYGPALPHGGGASIPNSLAIKFDLHNNAGEGTNSTGSYTNGASPTVPSVDLTPAGIALSSGHVFHAHLSFANDGNSGESVGLVITDLTKYKVFSTDFHFEYMPTNVYAGFTAGTGATPSSIKILNWTWTEQ